ncbi:MAG: AbrB/MazE/SpoVT family DNA-binding domain-containing protein [Patescibacteria group bacterium]
MLQSVLKIGNSYGATFPRDFVVKNKIKAGSKIKVVHSNGEITYSANVPKAVKHTVLPNKEFKKWLSGVLKEDAGILDELADR